MPLKDPIALKAYRHQYYVDNKDRIAVWSARNKMRRQQASAERRAAKAACVAAPIKRFCQDCGVDITETYRKKHGLHCRACVAAYQKEYRTANKDSISESKKRWSTVNAAHKAEQDRQYALANPERRAKARRKWVSANPGKDTACKAKNHVSRLLRVPKWLSADDHWLLEQAYELAALRTRMFGFAWHVDHILPLHGRKVSGLHVPTNVQVIPGVENCRKGNRVGDLCG